MREPLKVPTSAEIIDEYGSIQNELAQMKPLEKRARILREMILGWVARRKPEATATFEGNKWVVVVGPQTQQRSIRNLDKLFDRLGKRRFLEICSVSLTALEAHVPLPDRAEYVEEGPTGPRRIELAPIGRRTK